MLKRLLSVSILLLFLTPVSFADAQILGDRSGIWFSSDLLVEGQAGRIYVSRANPLDQDTIGIIEFYVEDTLLGSQEFEAISDSNIEGWVDWTPNEPGTYDVSVVFKDLEVAAIGGVTIELEMPPETDTATVVVDVDSDNDGVGDQRDPDDDNGGVTDAEEIKMGTDPKDPKDDKVEDLEDKIAEEAEELLGKLDGEVALGQGVEQFIGPGKVNTSFQNFHEGTTELGRKLADTKKEVDEEEQPGFFTMIWSGILWIGQFIFSRPLVTDLIILVLVIWVFRQLFKKRKRKYRRRKPLY